MAALGDATGQHPRHYWVGGATAEAFDDFGQFCQRLGSEIIQKRIRRGMPMPLGPDD